MEKRLVTTSRCPVEIEVTQSRYFGTRVTLTRFGADGWQEASKAWSTEHGHDFTEQTLADFLAKHGQIPDAEASQLADNILGPWLDEWAASGGREDARAVDRWVLSAFVLVPIVLALAIVGLVAVILLAANRI